MKRTRKCQRHDGSFVKWIPWIVVMTAVTPFICSAQSLQPFWEGMRKPDPVPVVILPHLPTLFCSSDSARMLGKPSGSHATLEVTMSAVQQNCRDVRWPLV